MRTNLTSERKGLGLVVLLVAAALSLPVLAHGSQARLAAASGKGVHGFDLAQGRNGYAVMAWLVKRDDSVQGNYRANVFVRTRLVGRPNFGARRFLGVASSDSIGAEVGKNGKTLLTWSGVEGVLRFRTRTPRRQWSATRRVLGAKVSSARTAVGADGTIVMASLRNSALSGRTSIVWGVAWGPRSRGSKRWHRLDDAPERIGFHLDAVAGTAGRGTVVWSGPCRAGGSKVKTSWVDLKGRFSSQPKLIAESGCVAWDIDLQADRFGNEYLHLGLLGGVQLTLRKKGQPFGRATRVSPAGINGGRGFLAVGANGLATLIWGTSAHADGYSYVTSRRAGRPSTPRKLEGARTKIGETRDAILATASLPDGRLAMLWAEIGAVKPGGSWDRLGVKVWRPFTEFRQPGYSVSLPSDHIPFPTGISASSGPSWIAWWQQTHQREPVGKKVFWLAP